MQAKITLGRFTIEYSELANNYFSRVELNKKEKKYRIKSVWDENFNRSYKVFKEKSVSLVEAYAWTPAIMGPIVLPSGMPEYISELLYELYNFEFPNGTEKKDLKVRSFFKHKKDGISNRASGLLLKVRMESVLSKKLDFIGPAGIFCICGIMHKEDFVTKTFKMHEDAISFNTGLKEENSYPKGSIGDINGGSTIYKDLDQDDLIIKSLMV